MPNFRKPDVERTVALTGDDLQPVSSMRVDDEAVTGQVPRNQRNALAELVDDDPSMRERTVPFYNAEATTDEPTVKPGPAPAFVPPPFPGAFAKPNAVAPPAPMPAPPPRARPSPRITSHVESPEPAASSSAFAPISTFPDAMRPSVRDSSTGPARSAIPTRPPPGMPATAAAASTAAPAWVIGYVLLCAALTLIGLVVLYFEHRMLGNASPL